MLWNALAEVTWPDVGLEFIKFLSGLAATAAMLYGQYLMLRQKIEAVKTEAVRGSELGGANAAKLERVETNLAENTTETRAIKKAVNGGHAPCGFSEPSQTLSGRLNAFQQAMVEEIAWLKDQLTEARKEKAL